MHITSQLTPLQGWLEKINGYITNNEILKARIASLALPIFEAWELLLVVNKICFISSREPHESFSGLAFKAGILALNTIFAGFDGFRDPQFNYQFHQVCGLVHLREDETEEETPTSPSLPEELAPVVEKKDLNPPKLNLHKSVSDPSKSSKRLKDEFRKFKNTPSFIKKTTSFEDESSDIMSRGNILTTTRNSPAEATSPVRVEESPKKDKLKPQKTVKFEVPADDKSPIAKAIDENKWPSLNMLIEKSIGNKGSWRLDGNRITFKQTKNFQIDPSIINVLSEAIDAGFLKSLNVDQAINLHNNLKVINLHFGSLKACHLDKMVSVITRVQTHLLEQWVQEDHLKGIYYSSSLKLISLITHSIQSGEGCENEDKARLFEETPSAPASKFFEEWKFSTINLGKKVTKVNLTVYDHYEVLKVYLQNAPESIQGKWMALKIAKTNDKWNKAFNALLEDDSNLIKQLIYMLQESQKKIWKGHQDAMLKAVEPLFKNICPNRSLLKQVLLTFKKSEDEKQEEINDESDSD